MIVDAPGLGLSAKDILRLLRYDIERVGSQSEWCRQNGVSRPHLNKVLKGGRKPFGPGILKALRIKVVYVLEGDESTVIGSENRCAGA
jgi:hypothetical protein